MRQTNSLARKATPVFTGLMKYFPDAMAAVAQVSYVGNEQHNPGQELHWDRAKSKDEYDACARHLLDRAGGEEFDTDQQRHMAKVAWRALAALQKEIENSNSQKIAEQVPYFDCSDSNWNPPTQQDVDDYIARLNDDGVSQR